MKVDLSHFIYGPTPKKGYSIRAQSSSSIVHEFEEITNKFIVPINPDMVGGMDHEVRMICDAPKSQFIYFSRIFKRGKLDERGRSGILNHAVAIPREILNKNLSYSEVTKAMIRFEEDQGIPIGDMPPLSVEWDEKGEDEDIKNAPQYISKESLKKIVNALLEKKNPKIFIIYKRSSFGDRINLAHSISKVLEVKFNINGLKIITEPPLPLLIDIFPNIVISKVMIGLKPNKGWIVVKPFPEDKGIYHAREVNINNTLDAIYGG